MAGSNQPTKREARLFFGDAIQMFCVRISVHGISSKLTVHWIIENPERSCFINASVSEARREHEDDELHAFSP